MLVHRTDGQGEPLWQANFTDNTQLQQNAGEYIVSTRDGGFAVYVDSQTWGSPDTGGNFAIMKLAEDGLVMPRDSHEEPQATL